MVTPEIMKAGLLPLLHWECQYHMWMFDSPQTGGLMRQQETFGEGMHQFYQRLLRDVVLYFVEHLLSYCVVALLVVVLLARF
jgi:hypothetical protein